MINLEEQKRCLTNYSVTLEDSGFVLFACFKLTRGFQKNESYCLRPVLEANKKG